ncbi:MAG: glycoside hydrolase family 99-like domain-containing protein [Planctomycetota bacterium]
MCDRVAHSLLTLAFLNCGVVSLAAAEDKQALRPIIGAIRWDAWYGQGGPVAEVERSLGPKKFHYRLPFFATVKSDSQVNINGDSQEVVAQEIAYASDAGLNYWAFVDYWDDARLSIALKRYLAAVNKKGLRYCLIEEGGRIDGHGTPGWPRLVEHFRDPSYQTVIDGRPLLFVFGLPKKLGKKEFEELADATLAAGLKKPYLVLMGWNPKNDAKDIQALGFDAVSAYAAGGQYAGDMWPYQQLTDHVRNNYWQACRQSNIPTLTFATAGWDTRPRIEHPMSWTTWVKAKPDPTPAAGQKPLIDSVTATPQQIATHIQDAIDWTMKNRDIAPANAIIIYGWNENDEGGWLIPTLNSDGSPNMERLKALKSVLREDPRL